MEEAGVPSSVLMDNAGRSAADVLDRVHPAGRVLVLAGAGNNGGDGMVLARTLKARGREVEVLVLGQRSDPDPLLHGWPVAVRPVPADTPALDLALARADVAVDGLLGTGVRGAPRPAHGRVIEAVNRAGIQVLALDVPSGVDADSGAVPGAAVRADLTVAFGAPKLGTLLFPGRARAGRLVAVEIGFPPLDSRRAEARLVTPDWARAHRPRRALVTHKKAAGHLLVLAGAAGMAGAAVLAVRGALRAGAGYVRVASAPENRTVLQASAPEAIFVDATDAAALEGAARECDALAAGPGMGTDEAAAERLDRLLSLGVLPALLLDADALTLLGEGRLPGFRRAAEPARRLLTPHAGEMARLGADPERIREAPLAACRDGAERWASALLLKGSPSVASGSEGGTVWVSAMGSSDLARAGIGDVLTGVAGAFLARGASAVEAGALALHDTGRSAALAGRGETLLPTDVAEGLGPAVDGAPDGGTDLELPSVTLDLDPPR